jgi:hypothetical protein
LTCYSGHEVLWLPRLIWVRPPALVMVQRQDKVIKCHANSSPVSGRQTTHNLSADFLRATVRYFSFVYYDLLQSWKILPLLVAHWSVESSPWFSSSEFFSSVPSLVPCLLMLFFVFWPPFTYFECKPSSITPVIKLAHRALSIKFSRFGCSTVPSGRLVPYWRYLCIHNNIASTKSFQLGSRSSIFLFPP